MSQIGAPLAGSYDLCLVTVISLIAVFASYIALDLRACLAPARGVIRWPSNKLMRHNLDSDHKATAAVPQSRARFANTPWRALHERLYLEGERGS